jgi:hypothetical protein
MTSKTASEIIDDIGAAEFVRVWKHRKRFPRRVWPEISAAFPELTTEKLLELERAA